MNRESTTQGVHHIGLTVTNVQVCSRFFIGFLGYSKVGEKPAYPAIFVSDGCTMLTLWQATAASKACVFDRKNTIGLHHLALRVTHHQALDALYHRLQEYSDVEIEFAPEALGTAGLRHMMTQIPGGLRIEFIAEGDAS